MANLETTFTGIRFPNPFLISSSPSSINASMIKKAFRAGWGGVVLKTIGMIPTENPCPRMLTLKDGRHKFGVVNIEQISGLTQEQWGKELDDIRAEFPDRPIIASIAANASKSDWQTLVTSLEPHGVNVFEISLSCPITDAEDEIYLNLDAESFHKVVPWIREVSNLPIWIKLSPEPDAVVGLAKAALDAGADAVVATDTMPGLAGIDLDTFSPLPSVNGIGTFGGYSGPGIKPISLRCVANIGLWGKLPVAGCGGISRWSDAAEYHAVGAGLVQVCTAVMWNGFNIVDKMKEGLSKYLDDHGMTSVDELRGKALPQLRPFPEIDLALRKQAYILPEKCKGCNLCIITCDAAAFEAIEMTDDKKAVVSVLRCDGCGLCLGVCSFDAIRMVDKQPG